MAASLNSLSAASVAKYSKIWEPWLVFLAGQKVGWHRADAALLMRYLDGVGARSRELVANEPFHITPGLRHRMIAIEDTEVLEVSTPELDDVVRLDDRYGRGGT